MFIYTTVVRRKVKMEKSGNSWTIKDQMRIKNTIYETHCILLMCIFDAPNIWRKKMRVQKLKMQFNKWLCPWITGRITIGQRCTGKRRVPFAHESRPNRRCNLERALAQQRDVRLVALVVTRSRREIDLQVSKRKSGASTSVSFCFLHFLVLSPRRRFLIQNIQYSCKPLTMFTLRSTWLNLWLHK